MVIQMVYSNKQLVLLRSVSCPSGTTKRGRQWSTTSLSTHGVQSVFGMLSAAN